MAVLVSIVVPTFNRLAYFKRAINSILNQTFQDFEIIVVDDDPNSRLMDQIQLLQDKRIHYFKNTTNKGASFSRNFGAEKTKGQYLAFLDDDDEWLPDKLQKQVDCFSRIDERFGVVYCGFNYLFGDQILNKKNTYYKRNDIFNIALKKCPIGSPTALIKKSFFYQCGGYDTSLPSCQDWDLWIRLSKLCMFSPVKESLALYRIHGKQISNDILKKINGREKILQKHYIHISKSPHILSMHYRRLGALSSLIKYRKQAIKYFKMSLEVDKSNAGSWLHILLITLNSKFHRWLVNQYGVTTIDGVKIFT